MAYFDEQLSGASNGFEVNEHASLVQSQVRNLLQAVMYSSTPEGRLRHTLSAQNRLMQIVATHRYDAVSFHAATLCTILSTRLDLLLEILDPTRVATAESVQVTCRKSCLPANFILNEIGVEIIERSSKESQAKISYRQMAESIIVLDLLIEQCDFPEFIQILVDPPQTYRDLKMRANWISRTLNGLFARAVDNKHLANKYQALIGFLRERSGHLDHQLTVTDITDEIIFTFWINFAHQDHLRVRLFRSAAEAWIDFYQALLSASHNSDVTDLQDYRENDGEIRTIDRSESLLTRWPTENIARLSQDPGPIEKILLKSEVQVLELALKSFPSRTQLWMTSIRLLTLSKIQNAEVEAKRRQLERPSVSINDLVADTAVALTDTMTALSDVEASLARLLLDLDGYAGMAACIETGRFISRIQAVPAPERQSKTSIPLELTKLIQGEDEEMLTQSIHACLYRAKKNRRGAFANYSNLRNAVMDSNSADLIEDRYSDLQHVREGLYELNRYVSAKRDTIKAQLAEDYHAAQVILASS